MKFLIRTKTKSGRGENESKQYFSSRMQSFHNMALKSVADQKKETTDDSFLWHLQYGHLNQNGLQLLKQKKYRCWTSLIQKRP